MSILSFKDLYLTLGRKTVLNGVSFEVSEGDYVSLVGRNGAGKSSLLRCALRFFRPSLGTVFFRNRDLRSFGSKELARVMAYVPQNGQSVFPHRVEDFVLMGRFAHLGLMQGVGPKDEGAVSKALELTGTSELRERSISSLSGGERQRVVIAAALAQDPEILLLDEVCHFLDPLHESEVHQLLERLNREQQVTILSVTHDVNRAALHSNKIVALKEGRVMFDGPSREFMEEEILKNVYGKDFLLASHPLRDVKVALPEVS